MKSAAGLTGYLATVSIDWRSSVRSPIAAVVGSLIGARLVDRIPADALRKAFGWFVLAMGAFVLVQEAPGSIRVPVLVGLGGRRGAGHVLGLRAPVPAPPRRIVGPRAAAGA